MAEHEHIIVPRFYEVEPGDLPEVDLIEPLRPISYLTQRVARFFFTRKDSSFSKNAPFKGFLLHGGVGTGKTELVKQIARCLARDLAGRTTIRLLPIDSSNIASPRVGESEAAFRAVFEHVKNLEAQLPDPHIIILFDDIESLMLGRGAQIAKEWHYSLSALFFHLVDNMDPVRSLVFATTNRIDLMDPAIKTRLYPIEVPNCPLDILEREASKLVESMGDSNQTLKTSVLAEVSRELREMKAPTIRDCRQITVVKSIEGGLWQAY